MSDFYRVDNGDLERFINFEFGDKLSLYGFQRYRGCGRRWHKVENDIIFSVQFVRNYELVETYYGFQPMFFPFAFTDVRLQLHNKNWSFFDADAAYEWHTGSYKSCRFYQELHPEYFRQNAKYYRNMLEQIVFSQFRTIHDLKSSHEAYQRLRTRNDWWDPRWLLECVALNETEACDYVLEVLIPKTSDQLDTLPFSDIWNEPQVNKQAVMESLRKKDYTLFFEMMETNRRRNYQRFKRAGLIDGQGTVLRET